MKKAAATWSGDWWKLGGGGTVWDAIVYDPKTDLLYFGTGNGSPWNQRKRDTVSGDNLYLASVIAVKAGHRRIRVALPEHAGGHVGLRRRQPDDDGGSHARWQGAPRHPAAVQERFLLRSRCRDGRAAARGPVHGSELGRRRGHEDGPSAHEERSALSAGKPFNLAPGVQGAHGWHAECLQPARPGCIYVPTQLAYFPMVEDPKYKPSAVGYNLGIDFAAQFTFFRDHPNAKRGFTAICRRGSCDRQAVWKGEHNEGPTGGALATAGGLVFQGGGSAEEIRAYDAKTGDKLWTAQTQTAVIAAPITYEVDGKQYMALSVGGNTRAATTRRTTHACWSSRWTARCNCRRPQYTPRPLDPPPATAAAGVVQAGHEKYAQICAGCHGENGQTRGANFPDLTRTPLLHSQEGFDSVVLKGVLSAKGMASFASALKPEDTQAIRAYIISRANEIKKMPPPPGFGPAPPHA